MNKTKSKIKLNPIMTLVILIGLTIVLSGILSLFRVSVTYNEGGTGFNAYLTAEVLSLLPKRTGFEVW